jgi:HlyD family type I secretion membrane fusion protein
MGSELTVRNKLPIVRGQTDIVGDVIGAFESETTAIFQRTAPSNQSTVMYVVVSMIVLAVALTCVVKVDQVVTSVYGIVVVSEGTLYVDPLNPSEVRGVNVKVVQVVKKGQPLAKLDPTFTQADLVAMQEHMASDVATVDRERAEVASRPYVFSATDKYEAVQGGIWIKRQAQYQQDLSSFDGQIHSAEAQMLQAQSDVEKYTKRHMLAEEAQGLYEPLLDKGYVSKVQVLTATDQTTEMARLLADAKQQIAQYRETMESLKAQRQSYIEKWYSDTANQLVLDINDLNLTRDTLDKDQKLQDLTSLDAPKDAVVIKIGKLSPGSIAPGQGTDAVTPGTDPLFTLAPLDAPVEAEVDVATTDVGFVSIGDPVQIRLDAYSYVLYGMAMGVVKSISEGSFSTDVNNTPVAPYFKVRVRITKADLHNVPADFRLMPGMTLEGDIMVGRRTIMSYLTETLLRQTDSAMREPN